MTLERVKQTTWLEDNQRYLNAAMRRLCTTLEGSHTEPPVLTNWDFPNPPALETLRQRFGLSDFELDMLLLCAGVELDSRIADFCTQAGGENGSFPTFGLLLSLLPDPHWSALLPAAPLRHWRLVELQGGSGSLTRTPLRIAERILHYLTGISYLDEGLTGFIEPLTSASKPELVPSQQAIAEQIADTWLSSDDSLDNLPVIQLYGSDASACKQVALTTCENLELSLYVLHAEALSTDPVEQSALLRLWERETLLTPCALLLTSNEAETAPILRWIESARYPLIVSGRERLPIHNRFARSFEVARPTPQEQTQVWRAALGSIGSQLNGFVDSLVAQFSLGSETIRALSKNALQQTASSTDDVSESIWQACSTHAAPRLGELAQHIRAIATWDDLVLPSAQKQILEDIALHVRQRVKVYENWGFTSRSNRGFGISALFAGPSGTGKTMAAEVLANTLKLELYRIDLSQVVSKYIGETEKNLRRVFDAAEESGAILFFDEADALFGKRTEVRDSHDRYANIEINYLLQRMEAYRGLAILATNIKESLDQAFMRRLRFVVDFPFPGPEERVEIWKRIFPSQTPRDELNYEQLARLSVTGGSIYNIAMYAAFLAAEEKTPVGMEQILRASRAEFTKLERALSSSDPGGWA